MRCWSNGHGRIYVCQRRHLRYGDQRRRWQHLLHPSASPDVSCRFLQRLRLKHAPAKLVLREARLQGSSPSDFVSCGGRGGDTRLQPRSDIPEAACPRLRNCDPGAGQPALGHARAAVADSAALPRVLVLLLIAVRTQPVGATCRLQVQTIANQEVRFADPSAGAVAGAALAHADADRLRALLEASGLSAAWAIGLAAQPEDGQVVMFDGRRKGPGKCISILTTSAGKNDKTSPMSPHGRGAKPSAPPPSPRRPPQTLHRVHRCRTPEPCSGWGGHIWV